MQLTRIWSLINSTYLHPVSDYSWWEVANPRTTMPIFTCGFFTYSLHGCRNLLIESIKMAWSLFYWCRFRSRRSFGRTSNIRRVLRKLICFPSNLHVYRTQFLTDLFKDPFLSSVWGVSKLCVCVSKLCVDKCLCVEEAAGRRRRARGSAQPKTRTPHKDLGKKFIQ